MPATAPRTVHRFAMITLGATTPMALVCLVGAAFNVFPGHALLLFMVYQLFMVLATTAGAVAAIARGQLGVARAFVAGYNSALATMEEEGEKPPKLRIVD